jgi:hypothetical protein
MMNNAENGGYGRKVADLVSAITKSSGFHKVTLKQISSLLGQVSRILHVDKRCKHKNAQHVLPMSLEQESLFSCDFQNVKTSRQENCEHRGP